MDLIISSLYLVSAGFLVGLGFRFGWVYCRRMAAAFRELFSRKDQGF